MGIIGGPVHDPLHAVATHDAHDALQQPFGANTAALPVYTTKNMRSNSSMNGSQRATGLAHDIAVLDTCITRVRSEWRHAPDTIRQDHPGLAAALDDLTNQPDLTTLLSR
jgi:hypothetical protein